MRDGALYGRGACDMKGGVVAGLGALRAIAEAGVELGGEAMLVTVPGEEDGGAGMLAAIRAGCTGDWAVITEPTRLEIVTAQAGAITFTLTVTGKSAHAAFRRRGVSAVEKLVAGDGRAGPQRGASATLPRSCSRCATWACPTPRRSAA